MADKDNFRDDMKRYLPLLILLVAMAAIYFSGAYRYFSFATLHTYHDLLKSFVQLHPIAMPLVFVVVYIASTALSVPGAVFLTLIGGYLFPFPLSTFYVVFSATVGATLLFLAARTALGAVLKKKAGPFLNKMQKGFNENAASYLLFLRFVPVFPFWLVNLAPAFFHVRLSTFVWTTVIGITPGSFVFTLAGRGLEKIFAENRELSVQSILNPELKIALVLLGIIALVPVIVKKWRPRS